MKQPKQKQMALGMPLWKQARIPTLAQIAVLALVFLTFRFVTLASPTAAVIVGVAGSFAAALLVARTAETARRREIEKNRHLDPLTGLLNHTAFLRQAREMIKKKPDGIGLLVYCDLDDLKFFNRSFGHDAGDDYIRKAGECVNLFAEHGAIAARVSGDEMVAFLFGDTPKETLLRIFHEVHAQISSFRFTVGTDEVRHKVRMSMGLAFYPEHGDTVDRLLRHADFAMFEVKHSHKGSYREFNEKSYREKSFLYEKGDLLDRIIESNLVDYAFQPIVEVKTGQIFAYEALMRPRIEEMRSPMQLLKLARAQSKLYQIEVMTLTNLMQWVKDHQADLQSRRLFINSIPNQILGNGDLDNFRERYSELLPYVVFELTEDEHAEADILCAKKQFFQDSGSKIALDDFGSGYSNDITLLNHTPEYLKVDIGIVQNIDTDADRQRILTSLIAFARVKNIKIIAEGCETYGEVDKLVELGVDYIQGFYVARPQLELREISPEISEQLRALYQKYNAGAKAG